VISIPTLQAVSNPRSIHGIYPYRGKISAIDAAAVISELDHTTKLLDPFCGSGTIIYEAKRHGVGEAWGTDINPITKWLTEAKLSCPSDANSLIDEYSRLIAGAKTRQAIQNEALLFYFHEDTLREIESLYSRFDQMSPYVKGCFLGAVALSARGCNGYMWTSSAVGKNLEPKVYVSFLEKFQAKIKKHYYPLETQGVFGFKEIDAREISRYFKESYFDAVFTSPPYFDALDYTAYYTKIIYLLLGIDPSNIKPNLLQKARTYEEDMRVVLNEIVRVTTDDAKIIFVVGDKKTKDGIINGGEFFSNLLEHKPSRIIERVYTGTSSQVFDTINKTSRKEQIVVWDKSQW
jgi:site-specific DNA-adenine methylase